MEKKKNGVITTEWHDKCLVETEDDLVNKFHDFVEQSFNDFVSRNPFVNTPIVLWETQEYPGEGIYTDTIFRPILNAVCLWHTYPKHGKQRYVIRFLHEKANSAGWSWAMFNGKIYISKNPLVIKYERKIRWLPWFKKRVLVNE